MERLTLEEEITHIMKVAVQLELDNEKIRSENYKLLQELKNYEDLEEQGLLVRLPCSIGTTVWDICGMDIRENVLSGIECGKDGKQFLWANHDEWLGELNDLVFLNREEAKKEVGGDEEWMIISFLLLFVK